MSERLLSEGFERAVCNFGGEIHQMNMTTTEFSLSVERFSSSVAKLVAAMGMHAENMQREQLGHSMAYTESDFANL